jgi:hypothetical protein
MYSSSSGTLAYKLKAMSSIINISKKKKEKKRKKKPVMLWAVVAYQLDQSNPL